jgi:hypothetical protein
MFHDIDRARVRSHWSKQCWKIKYYQFDHWQCKLSESLKEAWYVFYLDPKTVWYTLKSLWDMLAHAQILARNAPLCACADAQILKDCVINCAGHTKTINHFLINRKWWEISHGQGRWLAFFLIIRITTTISGITYLISLLRYCCQEDST